MIIVVLIVLEIGALVPQETIYSSMATCEQHAKDINELGPYEAKCEYRVNKIL